MEKITEEQYKLPCVVELGKSLDDKKPIRVWVFRRAYLNLLHSYWMFAVAQVRQSQKGLNEPEALFDFEKDINDVEEKYIASSISSYSLMRICISVCRVLTENAIRSGVSDEAIEKLQAFRKNHSKTVKEIIDLRNLLGAHPEKAGEVFTGSRSFSSHDERIGFSSLNLNSFRTNEKKYELKVSEHLLALRKYICDLIEHLKECWDIK